MRMIGRDDYVEREHRGLGTSGEAATMAYRRQYEETMLRLGAMAREAAEDKSLTFEELEQVWLDICRLPEFRDIFEW